MKKRWLSCALALTMSSSLFVAGCNNEKNNDGDVEGKTTIRVATYNGGLGLDWLRDAALRFEKAYENKSFEDGKTGVAVKVVESERGDRLENKALDRDVYLTELVDYYHLQSQGKLANISDVATDELIDYGENISIADKLDGAMKDFLTGKDGEYYAIPFYEGFYGFIYDVDMFELKGWFFDDEGGFTKKNKSKGLDGVAGTYDDGMPTTYAQFKTLIDKIRGNGVTPFVYSAETLDYFVFHLASVWADYEGKARMQSNWSMSGDIDVISSFDGNGKPITETIALTDQTIVEAQKQPGKYYALQYTKDVLMSNGSNYVSASDFKAAQLQLIQSCLDSEMQPEAVAMIIDGSWFENEAQEAGTYDLVASLDFRDDIIGEDYKKTRRFAFMPIPMVDESSETLAHGAKNENGTHKQTLFSAGNSFCFISAGTSGAKLDVSKEFLKFLHTNEELSNFTERTSITRPYQCTIDAEAYEDMSYFGKALVEMKEASDIVYPYSNNPAYVANSKRYEIGTIGWRASVGGISTFSPFTFFRANPNTSARAYFEGLYKEHTGL